MYIYMYIAAYCSCIPNCRYVATYSSTYMQLTSYSSCIYSYLIVTSNVATYIVITITVVVARLKSIMLLNLPIILSGNSFNIQLPIILKIIPRKIDHLTEIYANLLINTCTKTIIYSYKYIPTLNRNETLSTAKYFRNCSHRNKKCLIVGLSLYQ